MINLMNLPAQEAERLAYAEGFVGTAELFARVAELEAQVEALEEKLEEVETLEAWEHKNGSADAYRDFFFDCFQRLAGHYPAPSVTSDYDQSVIFAAIERGEAADANGGADE